MGTRIRTEITAVDVENYRRIYAAALTIQKDGKGCYYMTPGLVNERMNALDVDSVLSALEFGKDPIDEAARDALAYRKFTVDEVRGFKAEFEAYLGEKLEWLNKLTPETLEQYSRPCTTKRIMEELRKGNNGRKFVEDLYLSHLGWTGLED